MLRLYSDGGFRPKYKIGAYGYVIVEGNDVIHTQAKAYDATEERKVTNNTMELKGLIEGYKDLLNRNVGNEDILYVILDSQYVQLGITEWSKNWMQNRWRNSSNKLVKNVNLWQKVTRLHKKIEEKFKIVHVQWVESHGTNEYNNLADKLCNDAMDDFIING